MVKNIGNSKSYSIPFAYMGRDDTGTNKQIFICHMCQKFFNNASANSGFIQHIENEHNYTDAG